MQKSFIAITLALTLSCAFASYLNVNGTAYSKAPISVVGNTEVNFTNSSQLTLSSITVGELDIIGTNLTLNTQNFSTSTWSIAYRKLDGKSLTGNANTSASVTGTPLLAGIFNGYALTLNVENDTNSVPQLAVYQSPVTGGASIGRILVTSNTNVNYTPISVGMSVIGKTIYIFYKATTDGTKVNVTNFVAGGAKGTLEFTLTSLYNGSLAVVWGESLGSSQLFASWMEGVALKDATIDVSKGTVTANAVGSWVAGYSCTPFATDKKWFGDLCWNIVNGTVSYYVRSNTTSLLPLTTGNATFVSGLQVYPYGPYLAIVYTDKFTTGGNNTYSYDIWNLDTFTAVRNRTTFLTTDSNLQIYRVTSGGLYTLTALTNQTVGNVTYAYQNIQVGLVLGSSYLTSVLGFILTITAGLLLF